MYNFYKDKNVFYLQRQNKWEQFLSYTYQQKTGWEHPNPKISEMNKIEKQKIQIDKSDVELWLDINNRDMSLDLSKFNNLKTFKYANILFLVTFQKSVKILILLQHHTCIMHVYRDPNEN